MTGSKTGWTDPNLEGKALRKILKKIDKKLEAKTLDIDELTKLAHCYFQGVAVKNSLAKTTHLEDRLEKIETELGIK